jgi:hypothetical protein
LEEWQAGSQSVYVPDRAAVQAVSNITTGASSQPPPPTWPPPLRQPVCISGRVAVQAGNNRTAGTSCQPPPPPGSPPLRQPVCIPGRAAVQAVSNRTAGSSSQPPPPPGPPPADLQTSDSCIFEEGDRLVEQALEEWTTPQLNFRNMLSAHTTNRKNASLSGGNNLDNCDKRNVPRPASSSQEQPGAARSSQEQPEAARSSHEQPGAARSSQEQPGTARSSQEQPEAAASSQEQRCILEELGSNLMQQLGQASDCSCLACHPYITFACLLASSGGARDYWKCAINKDANGSRVGGSAGQGSGCGFA